MDTTKIINDRIAESSKLLAERIVDIRFVDINEMKIAIATHVKQLLYDCLRDQIPETEKKLNDLRKIATTGSGKKNQKVISEIIAVKSKLKQQNEMYSNLDRECMSKEMTIWMREHHPESILAFYAYFNEKFKKPGK